jgi:hypothetical protein
MSLHYWEWPNKLLSHRSDPTIANIGKKLTCDTLNTSLEKGQGCVLSIEAPQTQPQHTSKVVKFLHGCPIFLSKAN